MWEEACIHHWLSYIWPLLGWFFLWAQLTSRPDPPVPPSKPTERCVKSKPAEPVPWFWQEWCGQLRRGIEPFTWFILCLKTWHPKRNPIQEPVWVPAEQGVRRLDHPHCVGTCLQIEGWQRGWKRQEVSGMQLREHVVWMQLWNLRHLINLWDFFNKGPASS